MQLVIKCRCIHVRVCFPFCVPCWFPLSYLQYLKLGSYQSIQLRGWAASSCFCSQQRLYWASCIGNAHICFLATTFSFTHRLCPALRTTFVVIANELFLACQLYPSVFGRLHCNTFRSQARFHLASMHFRSWSLWCQADCTLYTFSGRFE